MPSQPSSLKTLRSIISRRPRRKSKVVPASVAVQACSQKHLAELLADRNAAEESKLSSTGDFSVESLDGVVEAVRVPTPRTPREEPLRLGYLCAEPLVYRRADGSCGPLPPVQSHRGGELDLLRRVLARSGVASKLHAAPSATVNALRSLLTLGCDALHVRSPRESIFDESRRGRGRDWDIPRGRVAATPQMRRGYSVETGARLR